MTCASRELVAAIAGEAPAASFEQFMQGDMGPWCGAIGLGVLACVEYASERDAAEPQTPLHFIDCSDCRVAIFRAMDPMRLDTLLERGDLKPLEPEAR